MARTGDYIYDDENYFHVWENTLHDVSGQGRSLEMEINLFVREDLKNQQVKEPLYRRITEQQTMYFHTKDEIEKGAQKSGLKIMGVFDGYTDKKAEVQDRIEWFLYSKGEKINGQITKSNRNERTGPDHCSRYKRTRGGSP